MKRIWIVNYYTGTPDNATNPRYLEFSHHLHNAGYDVITFNASYRPGAPNELIKGDTLFEARQYGEHKFVHVRVPHYRGNGIARMKSIFTFAWRLYRHAGEFDRPDVVLHNLHTPFDYPVIWVANKVGARYVAEAWDAWPDVFAHLGLVSRNNPMLKLFYWIEKTIYQDADQVVFTLPGLRNYIEKKGWTTSKGGKIDLNHVHYINNGVNLEEFDRDRDAYPREDADLNDPLLKKIVYMGSINRANHVHTLLDAAKLFPTNSPYRFFIYGDGADRDELEQKVKSEHIDNVVFKEKRIPLCEVAWVVSQATVNIMNYQKGFGYMGVSSGKMFQYLAAGKPIVCNVKIAYDDVITDNNLGVACDIETPEAFAQAIRDIAEQSTTDYIEMCKRVRGVAERFDYKKLAGEEIKVIEAALNG